MIVINRDMDFTTIFLFCVSEEFMSWFSGSMNHVLNIHVILFDINVLVLRLMSWFWHQCCWTFVWSSVLHSMIQNKFKEQHPCLEWQRTRQWLHKKRHELHRKRHEFNFCDENWWHHWQRGATPEAKPCETVLILSCGTLWSF